MQIGAVYPQIELQGDPSAFGGSGWRSRSLALTTFSPTTTCSARFTPIEHHSSQAPTTSTTHSTIRS